jgi:hypothetical protein
MADRIKDLKDDIWQPLHLICTFNKVHSTKKHFFISQHKVIEKRSLESNSIHNSLKNSIGIKLTQDLKDLYSENYQH